MLKDLSRSSMVLSRLCCSLFVWIYALVIIPLYVRFSRDSKILQSVNLKPASRPRNYSVKKIGCGSWSTQADVQTLSMKIEIKKH